MGIKLIGVHGESLGGLVATHLAYSKKLDFLIADRTFSCLSDVAHYGMGKIFKILFKLFTNWDKELGSEYLEA